MREIGRKLVHITTGILLLVGGLYVKTAYSLSVLSSILFGLLLLSLLADVIIADLRMKLPIYSQLQRENELTGIHSSTFFLAGALLSVQFFTFEIAVTAISILAFGDAMAAIVGRLWGTPFFRKKSLHGSTAMFIVSLIAGFIFLSEVHVIVGMALTGTVVELFADHIDDNLMIPLFSGTAGQLLLML